MRHILFLILILTSYTTRAEDYRHMVTFGQNGFGWSASYEDMDTNNGSIFNEVKYYLNDFAINYAYRFSKRWQLGGFYQSNHHEYRFIKDGNNSFVEMETTILGIFGIYNFADMPSDAFYIGTAFSNFTLEEENSPNWTESEEKAAFELDDSGYTIELLLGKRFSLKKWNIQHLTYSPQFSVFHRKHSRDFNDQKIAPGKGFTIQAIKFDFLF